MKGRGHTISGGTEEWVSNLLVTMIGWSVCISFFFLKIATISVP